MDVDHGLLLERSELQLTDVFLESSAEHPTDILETETHPSDLTLALFSAAVYSVKKPGETDAAYGERLDLPDGWRLLLTGSNPDLDNGYFGTAFIHTKLQQVVVSHRGTIATEVEPLNTNFIGIFMNKHTSCVNSAVTFVDHVKQAIDVVNSEPHRRCFNLAITGHSLGGWLAQITAFTIKYVKVSDGTLIKNASGGLHAKTVVFDSPGAKDVLYKIHDKHYTSYGTDFFDRLDITIYILVPNCINTYGGHIGTVYRVLIDLSKYKWEDVETGLYNVQTHAICNFVEAFQKSSPNVSEVLDWVKDSNEYVSLFMNQTLNQDNHYQVDLQKDKRIVYFEELKRRYHDVSSRDEIAVKSNLKAFSDDEIKILYFLNIIKKQTDDRILNEYLLGKNLKINDAKLFPDFEIDLNDRIIICKSKQLLRELTRRINQLMRWLGPDFSKAVEQQCRTADLIYRTESQNYLDSLQKTGLNLKDSVGLREFLLSATDRVLWLVTQDNEFEMIRLHNVFSQIKNSYVSDPINKYTKDSHYAFLHFPRLQKLYNIYSSPVHQNNLLMVDGSSSTSTIISSEVCTFLNNYVQSSLNSFKKLVFISSESSDGIFNSSENIKEVKVVQNISLMDLSTESQDAVLQRKFILTGSKLNSFNDFLGEKCSILEINQILCSDFVKKIITNEEYFVAIKDTRPTISDLQMPLIKTNITTSKEYVLNCVDLPNSLVVISGLNRGDLENGWEELKGKIILAEGEAELFFKDTCNKNQDKTIYLLEVSGDAKADVRCKQMFSRDLYVPRKFIHRACINLQELMDAMHADNVFVICSEEHKLSLLESVVICEKREEFSKNLHIAATKEEEADFIQKHFYKNIHFVDIVEQSDKILKLEWRFSHGSVKSLLPFMSTESFEPIDELTLSQTKRNLIILIDEPGMGKTTSLARLSRLIETSWVIHIELKQFKTHIDNLSDDFTPKNVTNFLLSECCSSAEDSLPHGLLEYLLQSKSCSKRVVLMFDGFDEIDDYNKNKDSSKDKIVKLFAFLLSKPTIQVFLTARKYLKQSLETNLSQFSTSFVTIDTQEQQHFLFMFWRSFLPLELGINRKQEEKRLREYAGEVLRQAKRVLGPDITSFMGIPLQLRMLAEVFRPPSLLLQSQEILLKCIDIVNGPNLYRRFISQKYEIYLHDKILIGQTLDDNDINYNFLEPITNAHGELGFKTFFPIFFNSHPKYIKGISENKLVKLNRIGLLQSQRNGSFQFVHRTYAEFCCSQMIVHWLSEQHPITYQLIKDILLPKVLLHPDCKIIRLFMNSELNERPMSKTAIDLIAECIRQLWIEDNLIFRNEKHRTALHVAIQENNDHIVTLLFSGLNLKSTREAFVSFITQYDINNDTALHLMDKQTFCGKTEDDLQCVRTIGNILKRIETCSDESKEKILFACFFNRNILNNFLKSNNICSDNTSKVLENVLTRVEIVESEISRFEHALFKNNVKLAKKILSRQLNNTIECYSLLLTKQKKYGMKTALHLAAQRGHIEVVKLLAEQTSDIFTVMLTRHDDDKKIPLHVAAECGHFDIVRFLVEHGAEIDSSCDEEMTALMCATYNRHPAIVKYLVESGAEINSRQKDGSTALHIAVSKDNLQIVQYLVESGAEINSKKKGSTALHIAASKNSLSIVKYLVENGAEINSKKKGSTALCIAVSKNNMSLVTYLIESGAEINSKKNGCTPLYVAVNKDNLPMVKYLVESGAEINSKQKDGSTALHIAAGNNNFPIIKYLIESGALINSVNNDGRTVLHIVAENSVLRGSIVKYLIESGAEINCLDNSGRTALYIAACEGRHQLVEFLLQQGADPDKVARLGRSALTMAALGRKWEVVRVLLEGAADANADGGQALSEAVRWGKWGIVWPLIRNGASVLECDIEKNLAEFKQRFPKYVFKKSSQNNLEANGQQIQSASIVMCNVPESDKATLAERILDDEEAVVTIISEIDKSANENISKFYRIGKFSNSNPRPIKVVLRNSILSRKILSKRHFKNNVRIYPESTPSQQEFLNNLRIELQKRKENGEDVTIKYVNSVPRIVPN